LGGLGGGDMGGMVSNLVGMATGMDASGMKTLKEVVNAVLAAVATFRKMTKKIQQHRDTIIIALISLWVAVSCAEPIRSFLGK